MRGFKLVLVLTVLCLVATGTVSAEYWFQTGARASGSAAFNNGAGAEIETVQQHLISGSFGAWVGETLSNGAFLQVGYLVENQTGSFPSLCTQAGCTGYENLTAGDAEWFYEYFPSNSTSSFLGRIGPDGSAGSNGTFNNYRFYYNGSAWRFLVNGRVEGSVDLGTGASDTEAPIAFIELANTSNSKSKISPVIFTNFTVYKNGVSSPVPSAYTYIGYGDGSRTDLPNPYGVTELLNRVNYFETGSGIPRLPDSTSLWSFGYDLRLISAYGNTNSVSQYNAFAAVNFSEPKTVYTNNHTRYVFVRWVGVGSGAYSGPSTNATVKMYGNVTEQAEWKLQYFVNATSVFAPAAGSGWYDAGTTINYSVPSNIFYQTTLSRAIFEGWSDGNANTSGTFTVNNATTISAVWKQQYFANATSAYGNTTGSGWYDNGSKATFSVETPVLNQTGKQRLAFYSWSNGNQSSTVHLTISSPLALQAVYRTQYLTIFGAKDTYGNYVRPPIFYVDGTKVGNSTFLFAQKQYTITEANYTGTDIPLNVSFHVDSPQTEDVVLPLYNVLVVTDDVFGIPVNATAEFRFANSTTVIEPPSQDGRILLTDVPYGIIKGNASYLGITEDIDVAGGNNVDVIFISKSTLFALAGLVLLSTLLFVLFSRRHAKMHLMEKAAGRGRPIV
jgi:hypothetical protein